MKIRIPSVIKAAVPLTGTVSASSAWAVWTPLITASDFTGIQTDLLTAVAGVIGLFFIILGVGILYRVLR